MPETEAEKQRLTLLVYDQRDVAEALVCGKADKAVHLFESKSRWLEERGALDADTCSTLLTALNVCLYQEARRAFPVRCLDCCHEGSTEMRNQDVISAGKTAIKAYKAEIDAIKGEDQTVERVCAFIQNHLSENLSLDTIASQVYTGKCYLCELFRRRMHCTIGDYVHSQRISLATRLLRTTKLRIGDIAESCGFSSTAYFSNVYRRATGLSPTECREKSC